MNKGVCTRPLEKDSACSALSRTASNSTKSAGIAWALDGDVLVIRIPLRAFARQIAEEALAKI